MCMVFLAELVVVVEQVDYMRWYYLDSLLWEVIPDDIEGLDRMLVWFPIFVRKHSEHARFV